MNYSGIVLELFCSLDLLAAVAGQRGASVLSIAWMIAITLIASGFRAPLPWEHTTLAWRTREEHEQGHQPCFYPMVACPPPLRLCSPTCLPIRICACCFLSVTFTRLAASVWWCGNSSQDTKSELRGRALRQRFEAHRRKLPCSLAAVQFEDEALFAFVRKKGEPRDGTERHFVCSIPPSVVCARAS